MNNLYMSKRIKVLLAATGINIVSGLLYIWSVISKNLISELNWTSKEASLPYTVATITMVISMVVLGKVQDNKGPRFTSTIGSLLLGTGFILSGFIKSPITIVFTFGIMTGSGMGILNLSTISTPPAWFSPSKKGLITGIVAAGIGFSAVLYSPLSNYMINTLGSSKTFMYIGLSTLLITCLLSQFLHMPPRGYVVINYSEDQRVNPCNSARDFTWREMLMTADFYKLWIMFAFSASAGLMIISHVTNIAHAQISWEGGFLLVIILAIFNTLGRFLGGSVSDKIGRVSLMRSIFTIQGINMFLFFRYVSVPVLGIGVAIAGLCYGATFSVFPVTCSDYYGAKNFGLNYSLLFTGWGFGGIIGPMTAAYIFDLTGRYNLAYITASILLLLSLLITYSIKPSLITTKDSSSLFGDL